MENKTKKYKKKFQDVVKSIERSHCEIIKFSAFLEAFLVRFSEKLCKSCNRFGKSYETIDGLSCFYTKLSRILERIFVRQTLFKKSASD